MSPSVDIEYGSHGRAHHHWYLPGVEGALNVTVVLLGAFSEPAGMVWFTPRSVAVNVCGMSS